MIARYFTWQGLRGTVKAKSIQPSMSAINGFYRNHGVAPVAQGDLIAKMRKDLGMAAAHVAKGTPGYGLKSGSAKGALNADSNSRVDPTHGVTITYGTWKGAYCTHFLWELGSAKFPSIPDVVAAMSNKVAPTDGSGGGDDAEAQLIAAGDAPSAGEAAAPTRKQAVADVTFLQIFTKFVLLGWTAFGGPAAHIALFQKIFVERLEWVSGLMTGMLFQYPGMLMMSLVGIGAAEFLIDPEPRLKGIVDGLSAVGVALVSAAALGLIKGQCKDRTTTILCCLIATIAYYYQSAWIFPLILLVGGLVTLIERWKKPLDPDNEEMKELPIKMWQGSVLVVLWLAILVSSIVLRRIIDYQDAKPLHWFEGMYRTGSIIFGGGQVVLPLLIEEVNQDGCNSMECIDNDATNGTSWMTADQFYAGLGAAQAMPGPLFNLAAYIGAVVRGVSSFPDASVCIGILGFGSVQILKAPAPLAVLGGGVLGVIAWATKMT
eukprot:jgi/Tetstr1/441508/TSEL_029739.t1